MTPTPAPPPEQTGTVGFLTDGTGVSAITAVKFLKDFVADFLITAGAALAAVNVMDVGQAVQTPTVVEIAVAGAALKAIYRAALRWATS